MYQVRVYTIDIHTINTYIFKEIIFIIPEKKSHLQCITCINIKKTITKQNIDRSLVSPRHNFGILTSRFITISGFMKTQ